MIAGAIAFTRIFFPSCAIPRGERLREPRLVRGAFWGGFFFFFPGGGFFSLVRGGPAFFFHVRAAAAARARVARSPRFDDAPPPTRPAERRDRARLHR